MMFQHFSSMIDIHFSWKVPFSYQLCFFSFNNNTCMGLLAREQDRQNTDKKTERKGGGRNPSNQTRRLEREPRFPTCIRLGKRESGTTEFRCQNPLRLDAIVSSPQRHKEMQKNLTTHSHSRDWVKQNKQIAPLTTFHQPRHFT